MAPLTAAAVVLLVLLISGLKVVREYERAVVFRLGRVMPARGPGIIYVIPLVEQSYRLDLRTGTSDIWALMETAIDVVVSPCVKTMSGFTSFSTCSVCIRMFVASWFSE